MYCKERVQYRGFWFSGRVTCRYSKSVALRSEKIKTASKRPLLDPRGRRVQGLGRRVEGGGWRVWGLRPIGFLRFSPIHDRTGNRAGDWYRRNINSALHRYTTSVNLCIALAPVHIFTIYTTANQKSPSKDGRAQD